jgi:WhiB family transcriptional regulator, redox-sensing transcriptional regulator
MDWQNRAACRDIDAELFFPVSSHGPGLRQTEQAKEICRACPVLTPCARLALASGQEYGVWGGLDEEERRDIRRRRRVSRG